MNKQTFSLETIVPAFLAIIMILLVPVASAAYLDEEWKSEPLNDFAQPFGLCVADIDGDGEDEILAGTDTSTIVVYDGSNQTILWNATLSVDDQIINCIRVGNVDDDDALEIVVAFSVDAWSGGFAVIDGNKHTEEGLNDSLGGTYSLEIADVDDHQYNEIIVGGKGNLYVFGFSLSADGFFEELWKSEGLGQSIYSIAIGDMDSEEDTEIAVGYLTNTNLGGVRVYSDSYEEEWNKTDYPDPVQSLVADKNKLYVASSDPDTGTGTIYIYSNYMEQSTHDLDHGILQVVIQDFNGDGADDFILGTEDSVSVYTATFSLDGERTGLSETGRFGALYVRDLDEDGENEVIIHSNSGTTSYAYVLTQGVEGEDPDTSGLDQTNDTDEGSDIPVIGQYLVGALCMGLCFGLLIIEILILIWVYKDATRRGQSGAKWLLIVLILGLLGVIIWLIVRPKTKSYGGKSYSSSSYSSKGYSGGKSKGKGKLVIGVLFLLIGAVMFQFLIPQMTVEPSVYEEEYDDAEVGTTWTVHGHLANEETTSAAGISIYSYSFEEDEDANFTCSEDLGNEGDEVIVTLKKTSDDLNQAEASSSTSPMIYKGAGGFFMFIGLILLIVGGVQASKGGSGGSYSPKDLHPESKKQKKKRGKKGEDDAGMDFSDLLGGSGGPEPNIPLLPPTMTHLPGQAPAGPNMPGQQGPMQGAQPMPQPMPMGPPQPSMQQAPPQPPQMPVQGLPQQPQPTDQIPPQQMMNAPGGQPLQQPPGGNLPQGPGPDMQTGVPPGFQVQQPMPPQGPPSMPQGQPPTPQIQQPSPMPPMQPSVQPTYPPVEQLMPQQGPSPQPIMPQYQAASWTCPNCGTSIGASYAFCTSCGHKKGA